MGKKKKVEEHDEQVTETTIEDQKEDVVSEHDSEVQDNAIQQLEELKDKYLRLFADFDNFKRRTAKERLELQKTASKDVLADLLPVLDDFDRATKALEAEEHNGAAKDGLLLIKGKLFGALQNKGLKPMETVGEPFDSELHEAITEIPAPSEDMRGKIIDEVEKGYYLNDKIIRFAKVVVGK